ncbi:hypothetical protein IJG20_00240 [Candidatus Saccharibacteria bacterium]|nr:hypothetical protein [Candidatus Saccharibacteria bacterium]
MKTNQTFKTGATSIYVVVIATLLFSVITVAFIRIIINESAKTLSDELSQAAYDAALAGVEDAKVALKKYNECKQNPRLATCESPTDIVSIIDNSLANSRNESNDNSNNKPDCDSVAKALGRISSSGSEEVLVQEFSSQKIDTVQAYTCVLLNNITYDYRSSLSSETTLRVIPLRPYEYTANDITGIQISWFSDNNGDRSEYNYANKSEFTSLADGVPTPPTISAQIIQTDGRYLLSDFEAPKDGKTNRGGVFLTPSDSGITHINQGVIVNSNDHTTENTPQRIDCEAGLSEEFGCVTSIELPDTIETPGLPPELRANTPRRNPETFFLILNLPYGQPTTDFSVQLCVDTDTVRGDCKNADGSSAVAKFDNVQIAVDSTGRANDIYSRVESRVEFNDIYFPFPEFAMLATGDSESSINKNFYVTKNCWITDGVTSRDCANSDNL